MKKLIIMMSIVAIGFSLGACNKKEEVQPVEPVEPVQVEEPVETEVEEAKEEAKVVEYLLYLKSKEDMELTGERFEVQIEKNTTNLELYKYILDQLINFNGLDYAVTPIPPQTEVKELTLDGTILNITLSKEFIESKTDKMFKLSVASIVNTMTAIEGIEKVNISIDGEESTIKGVDFSENKSFDETFFPDK